MNGSSPYLAQALQSLGQAPPAPPAGIDPATLAAVVGRRDAYQQANPGKSFIGHNLQQAGQNVMQAPGNALGGIAGLLGLAGQAGGPAAAGGLAGFGLSRLFK